MAYLVRIWVIQIWCFKGALSHYSGQLSVEGEGGWGGGGGGGGGGSV